jgi:hypothetical protein
MRELAKHWQRVCAFTRLARAIGRKPSKLLRYNTFLVLGVRARLLQEALNMPTLGQFFPK